MKTSTILLIILLVIVGLLGFGLQTFLSKGLTAALNNTVFPVVKSEHGLDVSVTSAAINLIQGRAEVDGLLIKNLPGYQKPVLLSVEKVLLKIEWLSLLKRNPIVFRQAKAMGVMLNIERNQKGDINVRELVEKFQSPSPEASGVTGTSGTPDEQTLAERVEDLPPEEKIPLAAVGATGQFPIHIRRILIDGTVLYADAKLDRKYPLNLRLTGSDLFTVPAKGQPDSLLVLRGALADDPAAFATDINAIVKPLVDPANPTFNVAGNIRRIDAVLIKKLLNKNDMEASAFSINPSITCAQGRLKGSQISLVLNDFELYGTALGDTALKLPLNGTLKQPLLDYTLALQSLFSSQSVNIIQAIAKKELSARSTNSAPDQTLGDLLSEQLDKNMKKDDADALKGLLNNLLGN